MKKLQVIIVLLLLLCVNTSFHSTKMLNGFMIVIDKDSYELHVFDQKGWLASYPCVFGSKNLSDKMVEGDRKTPEGKYHIVSKTKSKKWNSFFMLDYPNADDVAKFEQRKASGIIPSTAKIGSAIGIHGTWPHEDYTIDQYQNWTDGCISLKNVDITELYQMIPIGTEVVIRR